MRVHGATGVKSIRRWIKSHSSQFPASLSPKSRRHSGTNNKPQCSRLRVTTYEWYYLAQSVYVRQDGVKGFETASFRNVQFIFPNKIWAVANHKGEGRRSRQRKPRDVLRTLGCTLLSELLYSSVCFPCVSPDTGNRVVGEDSLGERSSSRGVMNLSPGFSEYRSTIVTGARELCILKMDCIAGSTLLDDWLENWAYKCWWFQR